MSKLQTFLVSFGMTIVLGFVSFHAYSRYQEGEDRQAFLTWCAYALNNDDYTMSVTCEDIYNHPNEIGFYRHENNWNPNDPTKQQDI